MLGPHQWLYWASLADPTRSCDFLEQMKGVSCIAVTVAPERRHGFSQEHRDGARTGTRPSCQAMVEDTWLIGQQQVKAGAKPLIHVPVV